LQPVPHDDIGDIVRYTKVSYAAIDSILIIVYNYICKGKESKLFKK
jgi:hypothetical protein